MPENADLDLPEPVVDPDVEHEDWPESEPEKLVTPASSLAARIARRREQLAEQKTVVLDVPGLQGILGMRYRLLTFATLQAIQGRHARTIRDEAVRDLYIAADTLVMASVHALDIQPNGEPRDLEFPWGPELARLLDIPIPDDCTRRQALLAIIDVDSRVVGQYQEYMEWQQGLNLLVENDEQVVADFGGTG